MKQLIMWILLGLGFGGLLTLAPTSHSADSNGISRHVVCYAGVAKAYEGDSDPSPGMPYYTGSSDGHVLFVDRKTRLLTRITLPCVTTAPYRGANAPP